MRVFLLVLLGLFCTFIILIAAFAVGLMAVHFFNEAFYEATEDYVKDHDNDIVHRD